MRSDSIHVLSNNSSNNREDSENQPRAPNPYLEAPDAFFDVRLDNVPRVIFNPDGTFEEGFGRIR